MRRAYTLVETLLLVAIVASLAAILLPVVSLARDRLQPAAEQEALSITACDPAWEPGPG